jgi:hypothetical protein
MTSLGRMIMLVISLAYKIDDEVRPCFLSLQSANITNFLISLLGKETSEKVQALLSIGISKLVLSGMITDVGVSVFSDFVIEGNP